METQNAQIGSIAKATTEISTTKEPQLGEIYKDGTTGFVGKATGYCKYLTGETLVLLESDKTDRWINIDRLEKISVHAENSN